MASSMTMITINTKQDWDDIVQALPLLHSRSHSSTGSTQSVTVEVVVDGAGSTAADQSIGGGDAAACTNTHMSNVSHTATDNTGPITALRIIPSTAAWTGPTASELSNLLGHQTLSSLEDLYIEGCSNIVNLPACIADLSRLRKLQICFCDNLANLPAGLGCLVSLQKLAVAHCGRVTSLPADIVTGQQGVLECVSFRECRALTTLPAGIGQLPALEILDLHECVSLTDLPTTLSDSDSLKLVCLTGCIQLEAVVGQDLIDCRADTVPATQDRVLKVLRKLARHRSVVKLATEQKHMLETLERLSWIAVLLATATFIGFLQTPHGEEFKTDSAVGKAFSVLDTWSFLFSLACLVTIVVMSMPRRNSTDEKREAGRFWLLLVTAWLQLYLAVVAGCGAFIASAFEWYPPSAAEIWVPVSLTCLMLFLGLCSIYQRFKSLYPGIDSIWFGVREIWENDLPFSPVFPCTCLGSCLTCEPCARRPALSGSSSTVHARVTHTVALEPHAPMHAYPTSNIIVTDLEASCCRDLVSLWRGYLRSKGIIQSAF